MDAVHTNTIEGFWSIFKHTEAQERPRCVAEALSAEIEGRFVGTNVMAHRLETTREWAFGVAITLTTLVCLFGFWRLSPGATFVVAASALVALLIFFWLAGKAESGVPTRPSAK